MKILVIGHSDFGSSYGAATSIRNHFRCLSGVDDFQFAHIYRKGLGRLQSNASLGAIAELFDLRAMWIPVDECIFEHTSPDIFRELYGLRIPNMFSRMFSERLIKYIIKIDPIIVHLNSVVLWPVIELVKNHAVLKHLKIIMHVRELVDCEGVIKARDALRKVDKFIFIDEATRGRFMGCMPYKLSISNEVVQNPFGMGELIDQDFEGVFPGDSLNFAVAGIIGPDKGVEFICESFSVNPPLNARLYIIGKPNALSEVLKKKYECKNIIFVGEIEDMSGRGVFQHIDCIIRGENVFCTGRSMYEALYAGGMAIVPGESGDILNDANLREFRDSVILYEPRSVRALQDSLHLAARYIEERKSSLVSRIPSSNFPSYRRALSRIYYEIAG